MAIHESRFIFIFGADKADRGGIGTYRPTEGAQAAVQASASLLPALAIKHDEVTLRRPSLNDRSARVADLVERRAALRKRLTPREVEVTARIVVGTSAGAIALDLGIAPSSIVTYRKRAYATAAKESLANWGRSGMSTGGVAPATQTPTVVKSYSALGRDVRS